jgi:hypothetical protein
MTLVEGCVQTAVLASFIASATVMGQVPDTSRAKELAPYRNRILGVYDARTGDALAGVEVADVMTGWKATTSPTGNVSLAYLPDGGSLVRLRKLGYVPLTLFVAITPRDTAPLTLLLGRAEAQLLPTVVTNAAGQKYVSPSLRGFEERRLAHLGGHFISDSTLRASEGEVMSSMLERLPGATLNGGLLVSTRKSSPGPVFSKSSVGLKCPSAVYVDGVRLASPPDFGRQTTDTYAGVEFYGSSTSAPIWISPSASECGVLLLWTRER